MSEYCRKHAESLGDKVWARYPIGDGVAWCDAGHYAKRRQRRLAAFLVPLGLAVLLALLLALVSGTSAGVSRRRDFYHLAYVQEIA